ncbi:cell adhesion molecule Dscam2-like isoform X3 [Argiope bruennichi]|uniref:cell adhesion molecule Dscam2-like isoform X3 n=1 Tax=Argiope bruennichi TaxID=94029 RepID=UPI00249531D9|nr:cell adhesion molecule Dscam2-like isoform X3 [Argiope bruennichi]
MAGELWMVVALLSTVLSNIYCGDDESGPRFRTEPPFRIEFSNSSGAEIRCTADGIPPPRMNWQNREGANARDIPGIRYMRSDGTLVFPPFAREDYRQDVHDTLYQCLASNSAGAIISKEMHVRGVVQQKFIPQVYDDYVIRGNTAVLRCHLPSFVREYVTLDSWLIDEDLVLKSTDIEDDKYTVLSTGELIIHRVDDSDGKRNFKCRARHRLTGELVLSPTTGKVIVTEPHSPMGPRITFSQSQVRADEGSYVRIPCVSTAQPAPEYRWLKETSSGLFPVIEDHRTRVTSGTLHIKNAMISDGGKYQCIITNGIGDKRTDTVLIVTAPLKVTVIPEHQTLNIGETAVLNCSVSGHPVHTVTWRKDQRHLAANSRVQLLSRDVLHITSVRREDKGMYQCFAYNDADGAQGTAEIKIGDVPPYLLSAFPDTTVHSGEKVSLKCVSAGNFAPRVVWTLYDQELSTALNSRIRIGDFVSNQGHVTSYLNITDARVEDSGVYRCDISNDVGAVWHAARLNVYGPPFIRPFPNISAISGQELVLNCPVGGYPIKSITWQKGGIILPLDHRHKISSTGYLTLQDVQKAADEGEYTCIAKNPDGLTASGSTYVSVVVAPVIDAQYFPDTITANEGERAKIICSATTGDPPIRFKWLKNGFPFVSTGRVSINLLDDSSVLQFRKVQATDRGQYTCVATNAATSTNMTSQLVVNVPPAWTAEPVNTSAILGSSAWMNCSAEGFPTPSIIWRKARESSPGDFGYVTSSPRIRQYNNGSLVLWDVELSDKGFYLCQANNGIGAALSKVIFLNVQVPPKFEETYQSRAIKEGDNTSLKCTAHGNTPIVITWHKNKTPLPVIVKSRYSFREISDENKVTSELVIVSATREESGMYACAAVNDFGYDEATFQLVVQGAPDPPVNLTVTNITSRTVTIRWDVPFNGNSHITGSSVQYKMADDTWKGHTSQLIVSGSDSTAILRALHPVTTYHLRVIAENAIGKSRPSGIINVTTQVEAPSGPPRELTVHPTGDQSLKVTWKPPREDARHGRIQGYHVGYRVYHSSEKFQYKTVEANEDSELHSTYVTGLQPFTKYEVIVKAYNVAGAGPQTDSIIGTTLETAPPTSPILQVIGTTSNSINIRWEKDSKDRSSITEYTLHYRHDDSMWQTKKLRSTTDRYTLENVKCGTRYQMYLTASNSLGTGEPSPSVTTRTKGAAPMPAPQNSFVTLNSTFVVLHLDGWQSGGCPILHFNIQYKAKYQNQWTSVPDRIPANREKTIVGQLTPDREYIVMVTAHSEAGVTQAEYKFRTLPLQYSSESTSLPALVRREAELPFHRNVTLLIPVVVSSLVLIIVIFTVVVCLRKHTQDRRGQQEYDSQKIAADSLLMSEVSQKSLSGKQSINGSHYSSPTRGQHQFASSKSGEQRRTDKQHEYAEPYTAYPSSSVQMKEVLLL